MRAQIESFHLLGLSGSQRMIWIALLIPALMVYQILSRKRNNKLDKFETVLLVDYVTLSDYRTYRFSDRPIQ